MPSSCLAARLRGVACGLLTATLAVAAHGTGAGTPPTGAAAAQLAVLAATVGAVAATLAQAAEIRVLVGLLAVGQLLGHLVLSAAGHDHMHSTAPPAAAMLAAHVLAIAVGAILIRAGERLCRAVSRAVKRAVRITCRPARALSVAVVHSAEQPLRSALLLAASVSHRGPPVCLAR